MSGDTAATTPASPLVGVIVLTQGRRRKRLGRALRSVLAQRGVALDVVCVGNGWDPVELPEGVRTVHLESNLGIPAGRNAGVDAVQGDLLFFLDDDARLPSQDLLAEVWRRFADHPHLGVVQPRVVDPDGRPTPRRWVPRIDKTSPARPGPVFSVWEGAIAVRRDVFEAAGRWPSAFFYAHEGIELAWRVWDQDRVVWYAGDLVVEHPVKDQERRHPYHYRLNARNRVWLARRNLPLVLRAPYVASWTLVQVLRSHREPRALAAWFRGWFEGCRTAPPPARPMSWRTVWRMTRRGRPPVV